MAIRIPPPPPPGDVFPSAAGDGPPQLPPVPFVTMSDTVCTDQLANLWPRILASARPPENGPCRLPLLAFFLGSNLPQSLMPLLPVHPDRLFLIAADPAGSALVMTALRAVALREPNHGELRLGRLDIGGKTPLREIFRQMAAGPLSVFSLTLPGSGGTMFFVRTPFTIKCLFDELARSLASDWPTGPH